MEKYHLYLDESESNGNSPKNYAFCVAGIIVKESFLPNLKSQLDTLKSSIWSSDPNAEDIILHELEIRTAQKRDRRLLSTINPKFHRFQSRQENRNLYSGIENIIISNDFKIIGATIKRNEMLEYFHKDLSTARYLVTFQIILENFCHFLDSVDGVGEVYYESQNHTVDAQIRKHYNQIKANGSMFINADKMQKHLREIEFPNKLDNVPGLQVTDFVPNYFARKALDLNEQQFNINRTLRTQRYDAGIHKRDRFGVKIMP